MKTGGRLAFISGGIMEIQRIGPARAVETLLCLLPAGLYSPFRQDQHISISCSRASSFEPDNFTLNILDNS